MPGLYKQLLLPVDNLPLIVFWFHAGRKNTGNPGWWSKGPTNFITTALTELTEIQSWCQQSSFHLRCSLIFKYRVELLAEEQRSKEDFQVNKMNLSVSCQVLLWVGKRKITPLATEENKNDSENYQPSFLLQLSLLLPVIPHCKLSPSILYRTSLPSL